MDVSTTGLILCGGKSRRMGADKALLGLPSGDGTEQPLLERVARVLEPVCDELLFACGARPRFQDIVDAARPGTPRRLVLDSGPDLGPLAGLAAGLGEARGEWVLVSACDLPRLDTELFRRLLRRAQESGDDVCLFAGRSGGDDAVRWQPSIGVYRRSLAACVRTTLALGGRRWIDFHQVPTEGGRLPQVGILSERSLPEALRERLPARNLNDPRDYREERAREQRSMYESGPPRRTLREAAG